MLCEYSAEIWNEKYLLKHLAKWLKQALDIFLNFFCQLQYCQAHTVWPNPCMVFVLSRRRSGHTTTDGLFVSGHPGQRI